jgi:hypothetical protein
MEGNLEKGWHSMRNGGKAPRIATSLQSNKFGESRGG